MLDTVFHSAGAMWSPPSTIPWYPCNIGVATLTVISQNLRINSVSKWKSDIKKNANNTLLQNIQWTLLYLFLSNIWYYVSSNVNDMLSLTSLQFDQPWMMDLIVWKLLFRFLKSYVYRANVKNKASLCGSSFCQNIAVHLVKAVSYVWQSAEWKIHFNELPSISWLMEIIRLSTTMWHWRQAHHAKQHPYQFNH